MGILQERLSQDFVSIPGEILVNDAIELIRLKKAELQDKFAYVYVVTENGELEGTLQLRDLLFADPKARVISLVDTQPVYLNLDSGQEEIRAQFSRYAFLALPVVDKSQKLIGVLSSASVADIVKVKPKRGMGPEEEIEGQSVLKILTRRLPWLFLSVISGLMCAYILGIFIEEIESIVALVLFIPIVLGIAGGVSVQSSVITTRGLLEGRLRLSLIGRVLMKEIAVGLLMGIISCVLIMALALLWQKPLILGIALGISLIASVIVSGLTGIVLPIIFQTLKLSPRLASGLFVLIICDVLVMIVYFALSFAIINPSF